MADNTYEVAEDRANSPDRVRGITVKLTEYFEDKGFEVVSHSVYLDITFNCYIISMIGKPKSKIVEIKL